MAQCPRCRGKIHPRATRCQHCQVDFTSEDLSEIQQSKGPGIWIAGGAGVLLFLAIIGQCENKDQARKATDQTPALTVDDPTTNMSLDTGKLEVAPEPKTQWTYDRRRDEVRNGEILMASIRSTNTTALGFPYGTVGLTITVRKHPEWGQDVIFTVDEGQIHCRYDECSGKINVDGRPETLTLNESEDNNSSVVFAAYAPGIIDKLRASKKVIVELPFFQNGNRQFTFETAGLEWPPKEKKSEVPAGSPESGKDTVCDENLAKSVGNACR